MILAFVVLGPLASMPSAGQSLRLGTTWAPSRDQERAQQDLFDIRAAGFSAVRMGVLGNAELYALADTLGLEVYQDLPIRGLPAAELTDTLAFARSVLAGVLLETHRFRSLRGVGLADQIDTSDPLACEYLRELSGIVARDAAPGTLSYYTTKFVDSDRCASTADVVVTDLVDADSSAIGRFLSAGDGRRAVVGAATLGTWTDLSIENRGLGHLRSPESQARCLERTLQIIDRQRGEWLSLVFVHRWRDPGGPDEVFADMIQRRYGLLNSSGGPRPSFYVASGFATGRQTVFAFPVGSRANSGWTWMTVLGWIILSMLGLAYAASPRMRHMVPRYFLSHAFYREAVISGRESLVRESLAVLVAVSGGVGMLLAILLKEVSLLSVFAVVRLWISPQVLDFVGALLDQPWTLMVIVGSGSALMAVAWTSILSLLSRSRQTLLPAQVMMLVVWPQWPLVALLLVAPAVASVDGTSRLVVAGLAVGVSLALVGISAGRTILDYWRCSRVSVGMLVVGLLLHPMMITLAVAALFAARHPDATEYMWHLVTRA